MSEAQAFDFLGDWSGQVVATAIHTGNRVRPELAEKMVLPDDVRFREEDPFTDLIGALIPARVVVHTSRFEVDLNRPRDGAVYRTPEEAWDLDIWRDPPLDQESVDGSLQIYDAFFDALAPRFDELAARGPFMVFDVHSYNHRRDGADQVAAPPAENPEVNVGTGSLNRDRFGSVVDTFIEALETQDCPGLDADTPHLDVRENVRFKGANLARWTHERYPDTAVVLALEFKKTFMDEWTGEPDMDRIDHLAKALAGTVPAVEQALGALR
ncbi:N-formylglutamate amidohydrolase [Enemella sp. A6]|uniref:N-formylglutamate amidohydrolase n=1 Tax=Enemella sp. A6 TaxID=3440152 RepID=UPI003EC131EC